jgi:hypothetical protein
MLSRNTGLYDFRIVVVISVLAVLSLAGVSWAVPLEEWNKTFGRATLDGANSVQQTSDGGYILAGYTAYNRSCGANCSDTWYTWLIKTDASGNKQWNKTFGGRGYDQANSVLQTRDGGYIIAGETNSYGAGSDDIWLIKTDANGNEEWNMTFGGTRSDWASSVQQTKDGGYIISGYTNSYGAGDTDAWLIKISGDATVPAKTLATSPIQTLTASPTQTLTAVPTGTLKVSPTEKAAGFEAILAIAILLAAYTAIWKRW